MCCQHEGCKCNSLEPNNPAHKTYYEISTARFADQCWNVQWVSDPRDHSFMTSNFIKKNMRLYVIPLKNTLANGHVCCVWLGSISSSTSAGSRTPCGLLIEECEFLAQYGATVVSQKYKVHQISSASKVCLFPSCLYAMGCASTLCLYLLNSWSFLLSGGQDSMQHGTVVAWKKQLEYTAARSNIHWRSSQNVHKCGPIKPNTCRFFLHDERNPANLHAWEAFCCHTAGCHDATHVRPSCLGVPSIQGSPNYTNADGQMKSKWKYAWLWKWMFQFAFSHSISRFPGQNCSLSRKTQASPLCETKSELFSWRVEKLKPWDYRYQGGLDADSFEQKHGCNIFKSSQINSQCLILNKFRFKEPANGQSLARQPLIGKYQNGILKNPLNREFKVTISRHLVGFNCDPILVICILYQIAICYPLAWSVKKAFVIQKCALGLWPRLWPECGKQVFKARVKKVLAIEHLHHPRIEKALYTQLKPLKGIESVNPAFQTFRIF